MSDVTKFARLLEVLRSDRQSRDRVLRDPAGLLKEHGLNPAALDRSVDKKSLERGRQVLAAAAIKPTDDAVTSLKKLGGAARKQFKEFEVEVRPFGITLLERPRMPAGQGITGTGTVRCTWSSWDGCEGDFDG